MTAPVSILLNSPEETSDLAARLARCLRPADVILLGGEIGSGKTHFARALIQSSMDRIEDVPSPTFTLVQVYDTQIGEIWHADLYRLSSEFEIDELGLAEAFDSAICLIEWPEKLGALTPASALSLRFRTDPEVLGRRHLEISWSDPVWMRKLEAIK